MRSFLSLLSVLAFVGGSAHAQEKYTIKLKELGQGDSSRVEIKSTDTSKTTTLVEKEKEPKIQETKGSTHTLYTETILERPAGSALPTKVKRVYDKAMDEGTSPTGPREGQLPYHAKTVIIEKKGDKYEVRFDDGSVAAKGFAKIESEFSGKNDREKFNKIFMPAAAVAVGESWKVDPKQIFSDAQDKSTEYVKAEGTAKLLKVYKKDDRLYGVLEAAMTVQMRFNDPKAGKQPPPEVTMVMNFNLDACIDGSFAEGRATIGVKTDTTAKVAIEGVGAINMVQTGTAIIEQSYAELPKK